MKRIITLLTLILGFVFQGQSQLLTVNQCESSPCNARVICGNSITTTYSYITSPASNPIGTCISSSGTFAYTSNWVYYRFTCYSTGTFTMKMNSNDSATIATDLDWAMWDITTSGCSALTAANVVECNAAGAGSTGIFSGALPGANYEPTVTITAGNTYIIGISNPSGANTGGFTMNFGGTASISDNKKPYMVSILPFDPCSPVTSIKIKLSEPVRCDLLNAGVDYTLSPAAPTYTASAVGCSGCSNGAPNTNPNFFGNATDTVSLTFATALTPGTYTITAVANAWRDLCSNADSTPVTLTLVVPAPFKDSVRSGFNCTTLKYIDTVYGVNGLSPYQYKAVGGGLPASAGIYGAAIPGYTIYTVSGGTPVIYSVKDNGGCEVDTTINRPSVLAMSSPNLSLSSNPPCHDQFALDSISSINQTGGTPPYTFSLAPTYPWTYVAPNKWKNINFSPALGVTFTVTVTDAYGCTKTGVKNLVNPSVVNLTLATPTNPTCNGDSTGKICFTQATGGTPGSGPGGLYTYSISPTFSSTTFTTSPSNCFNNLPASATPYTVTATDANGCTATGTKTLSQPAVITINTSAATLVNPTCPANCNGTYQPIATGGTGGKKYYLYPYIGPGTWQYTDSVVTSVAPNNKFLNLCAGTYTVVAVDAQGCTKTATFTLALPLSPVMNIGTITPVACYGGVGTIAVNITSATPTYNALNYTYMPSPVTGMGVTVSGAGGVNGLYTGVPAGTYDLIITNANACADTVFGVVMTQPAAPLGYSSVVVDSVLCFGSATGSITAQAIDGTIGANSYQYSIKIGAAPFTAYSAPTLTPYTFTGLSAGTYTIRVRDHNLCTKDSIVTIYQPTKLNLLLDDVDNTCFGTSDGEICVVDTGGVADYKYKLGVAGTYSAFQPVGSVYCFSNLAAGNYSVFTVDSKGCLDTLAVTVAAIPLPVVSYTASPNDTVCDGTSITLSGTGADVYTWTGGITDGTSFTPTLGTTQYIVTGTNNSTGCENKDTAFVLVNPIPVMNPIPNQIVCNNTATTAIFPNSSVGGSSYTWSHDATAAIGIGTNGTGSIPSFTAVNTGTTPIIVTFTVTPTGPAITNCVGADITFTITINPDAHITMDPASGSNTQTVCIGEAINDIIYNINGGGTGGTVSATLPAGVTGSFLGGVFTITGTPTGPAGVYTYTVTTSGSCAQTTATGTITVSPDAILTLTSPIGSNNQTVCINTPITNITYAVTGTGNNATIAFLPGAGLSYTYSAGTVTISGSPSVSGILTYTVTATGTCGSTTASFTINVTPLQDPSFSYASATYCTTGIDPLPSITGSLGGTFSATPAGLVINPVTGLIDLSASTSPVTYTVKYVTAGPCPDSSTFNVTITNAPSANFSYIPVSYCQNGGDASPTFQLVPPASGGVFSATPAGLDIDPATGNVVVANSAAGTYTVTNFIAAAGGCASASATATIIIDSTTILNPILNVVVCNNAIVPTINFSSTVPGSTYSWVSNFDLGMGFSGTTNIPTFTAVNTTHFPITANVSVTPTGPTPDFCDGLPVDFTITVNPDAFIALSSAVGTNAQTVCIGQAITDITYVIDGGGTGGNVVGLPTGVTGSFAGGVFTITGTPTGPAGVYPYTVTTTGTCAQTTATGSITVSPDAILTLTSPIGSNNQTVCINTAIINIVYSVTGTGNNATVAGLPAGVTSAYAAGSLTISGSPSVSGSTTYTVTATGTCGSTTTTGVINVTPLQDPSFTYPSGSYCQTGVDPSPSIIGTIGGSFSATPAGLSINAITGIVDLSASSINCYSIKYVTAGPCPDSSTFTLCITNPPTAGFSYSPTSYCQSGVDPSPVFAAGATGGTFSSTSGLSIDPATGVIDLSASAAGTYTVTNSIAAAGGCAAASATTSVTIDSTTIISAVPNASVCNGVVTLPINFASTVPGSTYAWSHNGTGIGIASPGTGNIPSFTAVNTGTTPIVVTFTVTPTGPTPNFCVGLPITFDLTINPDAHITLDPASGAIAQTVCIGQAINDIIYNVSGGGTGATVSGLPTGVSGSFLGGVFTINGSPTGPSGIYPCTVTTTGTCAQTTSTFTITVSPNATLALTSAPATAAQQVCENANITNIVYTIGGTGTNATVAGMPAGITGNYVAGVFTISGSSALPGIYTYTVTATGTCGSSTLNGSLEILPTQLSGFTYPSSTYCQTGTDPLPTMGVGTAAGGSFTALPAGLSLTASSGLIDLSASGLGTYTVTYTTPGPCPSSSTYTVTITTAPCATFTYAASNYCQSGADPTPTFSLGCSAGAFTATPAGLSINPATGQIDLSASNAGVYTITNNIAAAGGCAAASATTTVTIDSNTVMTDPADQTICNGANTLLVVPGGAIAGSIYDWTNSNTAIGLAAASGTGNVPIFTGVNNTALPVTTTITYTPTGPGPNNCVGIPQTFTITVNPDAKLTLTSAVGTAAQSVCINNPITNIVYTIGGTGTNATVAGLPTGVTASAPVGGVVTISGTPTVSGTFTYTVTATGTCASTTSTGTITVNPNATVTLTSAAATANQTVCLNSPITAITYTIGATGTASSVTGLPPGVTATTGTNITISGSPSAIGAYTYTVTGTGTCGNGTSTGIINVNPLENPAFSYPSATVCNTAGSVVCPTVGSIATPGGVFSVTPALSAAVFSTTTGCFTLPVATTGSYTVKYVTPGTCKDSSTFTINIVTAPCTQFAYGATSYCPSSPNPTPTFSTGCTPGVFTASPVGLSINSSTGQINLLASTAGTYTVTNTIAASGTCPASVSTFTVTVVTKPTFTFVSTTPANCTLPCNGTVVSTISGGTGTYTCTISPSTAPAAVSNTGTATGLCAGTTYTITATDAIGCSGTTTVSVVTATAPTISVVSTTTTTTPSATDGTATTSTSGGSGTYSYSIAGPVGTVPPGTVNAAGVASNLTGGNPCKTYTITVTDAATGCTASTTVCISAPGLLTCSPGHTNVTCNGGLNGTLTDTVTGGTPPYTFVNLTSGPFSVPYTTPLSNVISATGLGAGTYIANWHDANNISCSSTIIITQPNAFNFTVGTISKPSCSPGCDGTLAISATGGTGTLSYSIQAPPSVTCVAPTQPSTGNFAGLGVGTYTVSVSDVNGCSATTAVVINASTPPTLTITHNNPSCNNVCDGSATAVGLGGTGTLSYSIQSPAGSTCTPTQSAPTSGSFTTLGGGTYTITVMDTKGCTASDTETLVNPPAIVIDTLNHTSPLCNGDCNGTIHIHATGGTGALSYTLTPPTGPATTNASGNFGSLCAGVYTVSAHDANCNITATVSITQPTAITWTTATSTNITCAGSANGIINTSATGGVNPIQYSKDGVTFVSSGNFTGLLAGTYTITAKDANGCSITTSFTIIEPPILTLSAPVSQQISCNGASDGSITISAGGGTPGYVYTIVPAVTGSNTTGAFSGLPPGTYTITVTDTVGCSKASSGITITQPAPLLFTLVNHQDVACFGGNTGTITLNTSGGTPGIVYAIIPVTGTQSPPGFFSGLIAGTYTVVATDAHNCSVTSIVTINQGPEIILMNFTMTEPVCHGDANGAISFTVIGGTGQLKYQLNGGPLQTDTVFNNLLAGNYLLTIVDALGCSKDYPISVKEPEAVGAIIDLHETNCTDSKDGKAIIIGTGGRGGYKYYLTPGLHINKSGIFTGLEAGIYVLRVVDTSGCEYVTNININPPASPLSNVVTKQDLACNGVGNEGYATANVAGGTPPYTYLWSTNPPQTTAQASTLYYGYYDVTVIDANGCMLKDTIYIEEGPCCDVAFIPNAFSPNGDQLNDEFRVLTTAGVELIQLEIYDRWGKRVWATIDYRKGWDGLIDGKDAANDTYYFIYRYKCTRDGKTYTKKGDLILIR